MSSNSYRLVDDGYPTFKKIMYGRHHIGRVFRAREGYVAVIGKTASFIGSTEEDAFREVVARYCGFASAQAMTNRGSIKAVVNRQPLTRTEPKARYVTDEPLQTGPIRGSFKPVTKPGKS